MNQPFQNRERLRQLLERGSLARSVCSGAFLELISPLLEAGVLAWQRSGAGQRLTVVQPDILDRFYSQHFPCTEPDAAPASERVRGVAEFRDSKSLGATDAEIVSMRAWEKGSFFRSGRLVEIVSPTQLHGLFSFVLKPRSDYALRCPVALVENPAVFFDFERLQTGLPAAIYACGRISERLLDWLARQQDPSFSLTHCGDYDPVGLDEFRRLASRLGDRAKLYLPPNLPELFRLYSKPGLLAGARSQSLLASLRTTQTPAIRTVLDLIDRHNGGLEQEALLIAAM